MGFENEGQKAPPIIASFQNRVNLNWSDSRILNFGCQISRLLARRKIFSAPNPGYFSPGISENVKFFNGIC